MNIKRYELKFVTQIRHTTGDRSAFGYGDNEKKREYQNYVYEHGGLVASPGHVSIYVFSSYSHKWVLSFLDLLWIHSSNPSYL